MKTVTKVLGILGGIGAVVWAIRDRFISVTAPREPEPPTFRVVAPPRTAPATTVPEPDPGELTRVKGIGPAISDRLRAAGVSSLAALAAADPEQLAAATTIPAERIRGWQEQALLLDV
jgi:predicted flap endonuclease-1-like 5' DNA nuclease